MMKVLIFVVGMLCYQLISIFLPIKLCEGRNLTYNNRTYKIEKIDSSQSYNTGIMILYIRR